MKKYLFGFAILLLLSGCGEVADDDSTSLDEGAENVGGDAGENVVDEAVTSEGTVTLSGFTFTLPSDWKLISQEGASAEISIPDYEDYKLTLKMDLDEGSLPSPEDTVKTTSDGIQLYQIACGGAFSCSNHLAYNGVAYTVAFYLEGTEPSPENPDGIWVPHSSVDQEAIDAFVATVKVAK